MPINFDRVISAAVPANKTSASSNLLNTPAHDVQGLNADQIGAPHAQVSASNPAEGQPLDESSRTPLLILLGIAVLLVIVKRRSSRK